MKRGLVGALLLGGCFPSEADLRIPCGDDGGCPSGYWCPSDGICARGDRLGPPVLELVGAAADEGPVTDIVTVAAGDYSAIRVAFRNAGDGVSEGGVVQARAEGCAGFALEDSFSFDLYPGEGWASTAAASPSADCSGDFTVAVSMVAGSDASADRTTEDSFRILVVDAR
jgi:hypothetical protein